MKNFQLVILILMEIAVFPYGKTINISIQTALLVGRKVQGCETITARDLKSMNCYKHFF
jgi:hypothetical protein